MAEIRQETVKLLLPRRRFKAAGSQAASAKYGVGIHQAHVMHLVEIGFVIAFV